VLYGAVSRPADALLLFQRGLAIQTRFLQDVFSRSGEAQQFTLAHRREGAYYAALTLITHFLSHDPQALALGTDLVL
jgi:hypothetical protein